MNKFYIICDNIRSLENIGAIFRTADALGVVKIYLCGISGLPPHQNLVSGEGHLHPKIAKTALGAEKTIPFEHHKQLFRLIKKLKKEKVQVVALEQSKKSIDYRKFQPRFPLALIIGNEVKGISKNTLKKTDKVIHLPMLGKKESLNVSVAFGIAGYHINNSKF